MTLVSYSAQFVVLLVGELEGDLSRLSLDQHGQNVLILYSPRATGTS